MLRLQSSLAALLRAAPHIAIAAGTTAHPLPRSSSPASNRLLVQFNSAETEDELLVCKCGARNCKGFLNA